MNVKTGNYSSSPSVKAKPWKKQMTNKGDNNSGAKVNQKCGDYCDPQPLKQGDKL